MAGLFSRLKGKDSKSKKKGKDSDTQPARPRWTDAYTRTSVEPEEVHELIRCCTEELKARALDHPFLLLPFRPTSDPSAVRTFIRHFFESHQNLRGEHLLQELRMTEPMVVSGVAKWCWSRLVGGIVGWDAYELFKVGEIDSHMARDSFKTFIPISVENGARQRIIFDYFDLLAAIAAHGKTNGLGGRKLSRMAGWWAFEHKDTKKGFEGGYNSWLSAADATSHMFFAYLRSLSPEVNVSGITMLPMALQKLVQETEYPPQRPELMMSPTNKVVMIVDTVSPTPFALLRRANHFQYRDEDRALQEFSEYQDPIQALTDECRRVLKAVSAANQSQVSSSKHSTSLRDASWSRFEDIGFTSTLEEEDDEDESAISQRQPQGLRRAPASGNGMGRPTTPSWADFLSSGFIDENSASRPNLLLPPDKVLPPIETQPRQRSSQSHRPRLESDRTLEPGELASITSFSLDDAFWWVWMTSLAPEEPAARKSAFGRCTIIETKIPTGRWLVMEEMIAGAAPEPEEGAYIAEKKGFFSWTRRGKGLGRRKSAGKSALEMANSSKASIGPDTHARIQAKAAQLRAQEQHDKKMASQQPQRRGRSDAELLAEKTNSVLTLQPAIIGEASSALKWVKKYDKGTIKDVYLANSNAGRGMTMSPVPSERLDDDAELNGGMNGHEQAPEVPAKEAAPTPVQSPVVQSPVIQSPPIQSPVIQSPVIQSPPTSPDVKKETARKPLPAVEKPEETPVPEIVEPPVSPVPPPKDDIFDEVARDTVVSPEPTSPDKKGKKLQKEVKEGRGFRKLFRKNRSSKLPDNAAAEVNGMLRKDQATPEPPVQQMPTPVETPEPTAEHPEVVAEDQVKSTAEGVDEDGKPKEGASAFNQGPLEDQPAFVPDTDGEDDAVPPPIGRRQASNPNLAPSQPEEKLSQSAGPGVQDRWAQIRKNAAERAATRQTDEQPRVPSHKAADGEDDTSGEETIESRVARIKARVAELTGNMETNGGPQAATAAANARR
ncbi:hypothetical protein G7Z17_g8590 [Cylindrodendrum hubeiense]|uniref:Meiotically up-regulated protein Msb1/Mug8 domain-containing protein n=1 Tax=Cylindrodendrum hubeiense TaxID=595255 RepID=A0A9P5H397_9HYPO|nr:hypothetical protein G7Z17_g8590 [Cylindrodendrum hubeiense]